MTQGHQKPQEAGVQSSGPGRSLLLLPASVQLSDPRRRTLPAVQFVSQSDGLSPWAGQNRSSLWTLWLTGLSVTLVQVLPVSVCRSVWPWRTGRTWWSLRRTQCTLSTWTSSMSFDSWCRAKRSTSRWCRFWWASRVKLQASVWRFYNLDWSETASNVEKKL